MADDEGPSAAQALAAERQNRIAGLRRKVRCGEYRQSNRKKLNEYLRQYVKNRIAAGLCWRCGQPVGRIKSLCDKHADINDERMKRIRAAETPEAKARKREYSREWQRKKRAQLKSKGEVAC